MPFKTYPGKLSAGGAGTVEIQLDNASVEWDIYQISVSGSQPSTNNMTCQVLVNGFLLCNSPAAAADTATGPPNVVLRRGDILDIVFVSGIANDAVTVSIWFNENPGGTTQI